MDTSSCDIYWDNFLGTQLPGNDSYTIENVDSFTECKALCLAYNVSFICMSVQFIKLTGHCALSEYQSDGGCLLPKNTNVSFADVHCLSAAEICRFKYKFLHCFHSNCNNT